MGLEVDVHVNRSVLGSGILSQPFLYAQISFFSSLIWICNAEISVRKASDNTTGDIPKLGAKRSHPAKTGEPKRELR